MALFYYMILGMFYKIMSWNSFCILVVA